MSSSAGPGRVHLRARVASYLDALCSPAPDRHVGGPGNLAATRLFAQLVAQFGFDVAVETFPCLEWEHGDAYIEIGDARRDLRPGPYSNPADVTAPLSAASSIDELESGGFKGHVLVLHGDIVREQLTPKRYPFYRWDSHTRIVEALEKAAPAAIIAATGRSSELVGSLYPFPFIEDGDFDIPSAFITDVEGETLLPHAGRIAHVAIASRRTTSTAEQVVARRGSTSRRVVVSAHIDTRRGTPGAIDNTTGVVALLLAAELLHRHAGSLGVELVPFNGEDDYAAPGEVRYIETYGGTLGEEVVLNINIDGMGWTGHAAEVSLYECPEAITEAARAELAGREHVVEGDAWPQSDHMIFVMRGIPALAITTADASRLRMEIAHTEADVPALVDPDIVVDVAEYVAAFVSRLAV